MSKLIFTLHIGEFCGWDLGSRKLQVLEVVVRTIPALGSSRRPEEYRKRSSYD